MFELHYVVDLNELNDDDDDDNHPCHIFCQSVEGFLGGSTPKMAISYTVQTVIMSNYLVPELHDLSLCRLR